MTSRKIRTMTGAVILSAAAVIALAPDFETASVSLAWDPSPDAGVDSYRIHYGTEGGNFTSMTNVGLATTQTISGLIIGESYTFAVTAIGTNQLESDFSNQVEYTVPEPDSLGPLPPGDLGRQTP